MKLGNHTSRLAKLEDAEAGAKLYGKVVRVIFVPSDNGPKETGAAYASFIGGGNLPWLKKHLDETKAEFDARAEAISQGVRCAIKLLEAERTAEFERLTGEILETNKAVDNHPEYSGGP